MLTASYIIATILLHDFAKTCSNAIFYIFTEKVLQLYICIKLFSNRITILKTKINFIETQEIMSENRDTKFQCQWYVS